MKAFARFKELASSVARTNGSVTAAAARGARGRGSATESVDEQLALLVATIEAEARAQHVPERGGVVEGRSAGPAGSRKRPHLLRLSIPALAARLWRRFRRWRPQILLYAAVVLLGLAAGLLVALIGS
jgi:hypothetical protein